MSSELRRHNVRADQKALRVLAIGMFIASLLLLVATTSLAGTSAETSRYLSKLIVVGQGVSGVRLGDSPKRVTAILGKPASTQPPYWTYPQVGERITFENNEVTDVWTESIAERTSNGVGPGTSRQHLRSAYPKSQCKTARYTSAQACSLLSTIHGRSRETDFLILGTTVRAVEVYFTRSK
jgi:hypothetical protein